MCAPAAFVFEAVGGRQEAEMPEGTEQETARYSEAVFVA